MLTSLKPKQGSMMMPSRQVYDDRYWVVGGVDTNVNTSGNWAASSGGAGGETVPTSADDVYLDGNSGAGNVTINTTFSCKTFICTGFTGTVNGDSNLDVYGNITLVAGMTWGHSGARIRTLAASTVTCAGHTLNNDFYHRGAGKTVTLQDAMNLGTTKNFVQDRGHVDTNGQTVTCNNWTSNPGASSNLTLGASIINIRTNFTVGTTVVSLDAGTSTIKLGTDTVVSSILNLDVGFTFYNIEYVKDGGTLNITDSFTCNEFKCSGADTPTVVVTAGKTITVTSLDINGISGKLTTLESSSGGSAWNLVDSSGTNTFSYVSFQDCAASGGATFDASDGTNVDVSGNSGINFGGWSPQVIIIA